MKIRSLLVIGATVAAVAGSFSSATATHAGDPRVCAQASAFPKRVITKLPQASGTVIYIDDRQKTATPDPGLVDGGNGTWGYLESNNRPGLQTGGLQAAFDAIHDVELADETGEHDKQYCNENGTVNSGTSDTIIF